MRQGFKLADWALLLTLGPLFLLCFGLHVFAVADRQSARPDFFVSPSATDADYPVVQGYIREADRTSTVAIGDRVLRVGGVSMQGKGESEVVAAAARERDSKLRVEVELEREGVRQTQRITLTDRRFPWSDVPLLLGFAVLALVILLRAPGTSESRLTFAAFASFAVFQSTLYVSPLDPFGLSARPLAGVLAIGLFGVWVTRFPPGLRPDERASIAWPLGVALLWLAARVNFALGGFGLEWNSEIYLTVDLVIAITLLTILSRNFRRADPVGRRQIKWVLYGGFVAAAPMALLSALGLVTATGFAALHPIAMLFGVALPIGFLIAIVRYSLFDIDRIISSTTSYSILGVVFITAGLVLVPRLAAAASGPMGIDPSTSQLALSLGFAVAVIPIHRRLRPRIDRLFFTERYAVDQGMTELLPLLSGATDPRQLTERLGRGLEQLFRPDACVIYALDADADSFSPVYAEGQGVPPAFETSSPLIVTLRGRHAPLALGEGAQRGDDEPLGPFDRAALATLGAEVVIPVRQGDDLAAFVCLGTRRSGDIYTATDLSRLAAVGGLVSSQLTRFDQEMLIREGQSMQRELRRYVPGAIADQLEAGQELDKGEREVSVLFVDIRGYTNLSEGRDSSEIFSTVNRYTEAVSGIVRKHGGSVVEFNGDGMMVVFGAPRELAHKERAAVESGREIVASVGSMRMQGTGERLAVGVGVATGEAFVGNIQAVDRMIWSAIGNTTNLAARLQGLTRELDAALVIDAATWERARPAAADFEQIPDVPIRGRRESQDVYALPLRRSP